MQQLAMAPALRDGNCEAEDRFVSGFAAALVARQPVGVGCGRARVLAQALLDVAEVSGCLPGELTGGALSLAVRQSGLHTRLSPVVTELLGGRALPQRPMVSRSLAS